METFWGIRCVWLRYFDVFRKNLIYGVVTTFVEPLLFILAFGVGLGKMIGSIETSGVRMDYRPFILTGILGQTLLFQAFFEAAYGAFVRMYYQRIFQAMAITPITLSEVLWGELLWDASRATLAAVVVSAIGVTVGDFSPLGTLIALPFFFLISLLFAAIGLWVAAISRTIEVISYPQYLFIFPMFLFCGVFFPLENLPVLLQPAVWLLPLTPVISLIRWLTLGFPLEVSAVPLVMMWLVFFVWISRRQMTRRLVK